jgi:hypothetical protein
MLGAIGGYLSGRAQAPGTVEGVRLQLSEQRTEALWQAKTDACAQFVDAWHHALFDSRCIYGTGSHDQLLKELPDLQDECALSEDECALSEVALLLQMPSTEAESARAVDQSLTFGCQRGAPTVCSTCSQTDDEADRHREADESLATCRQLLRAFTAAAQQRFSQPGLAPGATDM